MEVRDRSADPNMLTTGMLRQDHDGLAASHRGDIGGPYLHTALALDMYVLDCVALTF